MTDTVPAIRIEMPLPHKALSPNARVHYLTKAKKVKEYRAIAHYSAIAKTPFSQLPDRGWPEATTQATFYHPTRGRRDADNLLASLKPAFDGIADAGVILDDSGLVHLPVRKEVDKENPRVEILVAQGRHTHLEIESP